MLLDSKELFSCCFSEDDRLFRRVEKGLMFLPKATCEICAVLFWDERIKKEFRFLRNSFCVLYVVSLKDKERQGKPGCSFAIDLGAKSGIITEEKCFGFGL